MLHPAGGLALRVIVGGQLAPLLRAGAGPVLAATHARDNQRLLERAGGRVLMPFLPLLFLTPFLPWLFLTPFLPLLFLSPFILLPF